VGVFVIVEVLWLASFVGIYNKCRMGPLNTRGNYYYYEMSDSSCVAIYMTLLVYSSAPTTLAAYARPQPGLLTRGEAYLWTISPEFSVPSLQTYSFARSST